MGTTLPGDVMVERAAHSEDHLVAVADLCYKLVEHKVLYDVWLVCSPTTAECAYSAGMHVHEQGRCDNQRWHCLLV